MQRNCVSHKSYSLETILTAILILYQHEVGNMASNILIKRSVLYPEKDEFFSAIQNRVVSIRNYYKHLLYQDAIGRCRLSGISNESIQQIFYVCYIMAHSVYTRRYNNIAGIIHQQLAVSLGLLTECLSFCR